MADTSLDDIEQFRFEMSAGKCLFEEGDSGDDMYLIASGEVELLIHVGGEEKSIAKLEQGDFFGEMSLLDSLPRECTARAVDDCQLLRLDSATFDRIIREVPEIPVRMLRKLARRLRHHLEDEARAARIAWGQVRPPSKASGRRPAVQDTPPAEPSVAPASAVLVLTTDEREFALSDRGETTVGRPDHSTGQTPDIDLSGLEQSRTLSRRHAQIDHRDDGFYIIEQVGTGNGTYVNEHRLEGGVPLKLNHGDSVRFGLVETIFQLRE